jgi:hypothetical protein
VVGSVPETAIGHLTMLKLPDDDFVTVELVHDPRDRARRGRPGGRGRLPDGVRCRPRRLPD